MSLAEPFLESRRNPQPTAFARASDFMPGNTFRRMTTARVISQVLRVPTPLDVAIDRWPHDRMTHEIIQRAAVTPAMTTVTGWAAELAQRLVVDTLMALGPMSAAAQLLRDGLVLNFDGRGIISVPGFVADVGDAAWVVEGDPIPVVQMAVTPGLMQPYKIASIAVLTREMIESSNAEALVGDALMRAAGLALDAVFFSNQAATPAHPAGIRNGISTVAPGSGSGTEGMIEDVGNLLNVVGTVGGPGPYALIAGAGRAATLGLRFVGNLENVRVYISPALGNDMMAIACQALAAALSVNPDLETSKAASVHMSDTPAAIGSATPARSLYQTDSIAVKVRWPATWVLRHPSGVAWVTPTWK